MIELRIDQNYIDQRDLQYESHKRGTNYIASVYKDLSQPNGLSREFWKKGTSIYKYIPDKFDFIEVASDYKTAVGNKYRRRSYYRFIKIENNILYLEEIIK